MKKQIALILVLAVSMADTNAQNIYSTDNGHVSFYSKAPITDVDAANEKVNVELNKSTKALSINMAMKDFKFKSAKMGRDAEKNYIETDAYPTAGFTGRLNGTIDYDKPGSYPATANGKLSIHGVEKEISEKGVVIVQKGQVRLESQFKVKLKDYNIKTPKILGHEMTEEDILVKIKANLTEGASKPTRK